MAGTTTTARAAVIVVGHGGIATDTPPALVAELKRLEAARQRAGGAATEREREMDSQVRGWPRSAATDPYQAGLEAVAERLRARLPGVAVTTAYNEFCAPSVADAIDAAVAAGATRVTLVTTMFTPGGAHSEREIPRDVAAARARHPGVDVRYAWPFDLDRAAALLAETVAAHQG